MTDPQTSSPEPLDSDATATGDSLSPPVLELVTAKLTDVGRARPRNEDFVEYHVPTDPEQLARKGSIYLVADGMGGHQAGEVASQSAVEIVVANYYTDDTSDIGAGLVRAFRLANQEIYAMAQTDPSMSGMGTTLVAAVILGRKVYVANVGDSRAYLINNGGMVQITEDHSWVEEQVRAGLLTPEQARRHPQRNLVTRALGSRPSVEVDLFVGEIDDGDTLLLCTDGLTGRVEDPEIASVVQSQHPQEAVQTLVQLANDRGGNDNISVLIVSTQADLPAVTAPVFATASGRPSRWSLLVLILLGAVAVLVLVIGGLLAVRFLLPAESEATATLPTARATGTVTAGLEPSVTEAAVLDPTETPSPTPTAESLGPTATLAPVPTETPQPTPSETILPPTATSTPTSTASPTSPPPVILAPDDGEVLTGHVAFNWQWDSGRLPDDYAFDLRIWAPAEGRPNARGAEGPTRQTTLEVDLQFVPAISEFGVGPYNWGVVVVWIPCALPAEECQPQIVSEWSETRTFTYTGEPEPTP
jgi:serine/threonine protein phosphatase PrpC